MSDFSKEKFRTAIIIVVSAFLLLWIILSERLFFEAKVYGSFGILTILGLFGFNYFWRKSRHQSIDKAYFGISDRWVRGILVGVGFVILFVIMTQIKIFASVAQILVPSVILASAGASFVVICLIAPFTEELFYRGTLASYLGLTKLPFVVVAGLCGIIFSASHLYSYLYATGGNLGGIGLMAGAFLGAGIFGMGSCYLAKYFGLESSITSHFLYNFYNWNLATSFLAVA